MNIVNLTPHAITIRLAGLGTIPTVDRVIPSSGTIARVATRSVSVENVDGIPAVTTVYGAPEGVPEPADGTIYLVSAIVLAAMKRQDVYAPDTSPESVVRDDAGKIVAVRRLVRSV